MATAAAAAAEQCRVVERLRLAIVGCGQIVVHHIAALAALDEQFEVVALCDPSAERRTIIRELLSSSQHNNTILSPQEGVAEYESLTDLLKNTSADECPVLFISVPHDLHAPLASQAMDADRHVVMEKPLAPTNHRRVPLSLNKISPF